MIYLGDAKPAHAETRHCRFPGIVLFSRDLITLEGGFLRDQSALYGGNYARFASRYPSARVRRRQVSNGHTFAVWSDDERCCIVASHGTPHTYFRLTREDAMLLLLKGNEGVGVS